MTGRSAVPTWARKISNTKSWPSSEQRGADAASYPLKLLQSEGVLKIASTGQRPGERETGDARIHRRRPGDAVPHDHAAHEVDEELLNRFALRWTVNEDAASRRGRSTSGGSGKARTIEGYLLRRKRAKLGAATASQTREMLLRPLAVVNNHDVEGEVPRLYDAGAARPR